MSTQVNKANYGAGFGGEMSGIKSSSMEPKILKNFRFLSLSDRSYIGLQTNSRRSSFENSIQNEEEIPEYIGDDVETISLHSFDSIASAQLEQVTSYFISFSWLKGTVGVWAHRLNMNLQ